MRKKLIVWFSIISFSLCCGCAHYHYQDDLFKCPVLPSANKINKTIGMNELLDKRPSDERFRFPPDNVWKSQFELNQTTYRKRITEVLLRDFKDSGLFKEVHSPAQPQDDYVIDGSIERLVMKTENTFWETNPVFGILPFLKFPVLFGVPVRQEYCIVDISLKVRDNKTNTVIANIRGYSKAVLDASIYTSELGQDVTEAFCNVTNKLKKELAEKINKK